MTWGCQKRSTSAAAKITTLCNHTKNELERSTIFQLGKSTISTGPFSIANCNKLPEATTHQGFIIRKSRAFLWKKNIYISG